MENSGSFLMSLWEILLNSLSFLFQAGIVALLLILVLIVAIQLFKGDTVKSKKKIEVEDLGRNLENYSMQVKKYTINKKLYAKAIKNLEKKRKDVEIKNIYGPIVYVIDFEGDIQASKVQLLREEISTILEVADPKKDEVIVRVESRGGAVHGYGLAASQLQRVRDRKIPLTICVDKVAASGGYMMACVGNKILAAPFAIVGSIGVYAGVPNIHRFLKKHDVDFEEVTAGEYKRTVSLFGEISEKGRKKFLEQIEEIHQLFKSFVHQNRPSLEISKVSTGEYWYGIRAKELGLIDKIQSSDDYFTELLKRKKRIFKIKLCIRESLLDKLKKPQETSLLNRLSQLSKWNKKDLDLTQNHPNILPDYFM